MIYRKVAAAIVITSLGLTQAQAANINDNHDRVWNFTDQMDGAYPRGDLLIDAAFNIYGTTATGGSSGDGAVWMLVPSLNPAQPGSMNPLYSFTGGADGSLPSAGLVEDASGALYGTAMLDGVSNGGTVFQLLPPQQGQTSWTENTLWSFGAAGDGVNPVGNLVFDGQGNLYGTTDFGGAYGAGIVFMLTPPVGGVGPWTETILWSFTGGPDGANPLAGLIFDASGNLYGTTKSGGSNGAGTVFELAPANNGTGSWLVNTLWSFTGGADGAAPMGELTADGQGGVYGTTQFGGAVNPNCDQARFPYYGEPDSETQYAENAAYVPPGGNACGVIFDLSPPGDGSFPWTETIPWGFSGTLDGANPVASLVADTSGNLYGSTTEYGHAHNGTLFKLAPPGVQGNPWSLTTLTSFDGLRQGFYPRSSLAWGLDGRLYGSTIFGGTSWTHVSNHGYGVVFTSTP